MKTGLIEGKRARKYSRKIKDTERSEKYNDFILKEIRNRSNQKIKVVEFCCGPGNTLDILKEKVDEIVGIDGSKEMIKICKEKFRHNPNVKLINSSVTETNLPANYFDYVIIRMGLHHIKNKEKVINEISRILKEKGKVIIIDRFYSSFIKFKFRELYRLLFKLKTTIFSHFDISKKEMEELLTRKFNIIKKDFFPTFKNTTGQSFMFVLEKK
jgi:ubiquinone/menaquinone biosynthesis C-methylase UbiE